MADVYTKVMSLEGLSHLVPSETGLIVTLYQVGPGTRML